MNETREFLDTVIPWPAAGEAAFLNLHWTKWKNGPSGRPYWGGKACTSLDQMVRELAIAINQTKAVRDIYICLSSQSEQDVGTWPDGRPKIEPKRAQSNVVAMRSLYLDIDVKPGQYETQQQALDALVAFLDAIDMPDPTYVVSSGSGGLHVYWSFEHNITREEWQTLANCLVHATLEHGLHCDTGVTIDSARVLRVPGTWNKKTDTFKPVTILNQGDRVTLEVIGATLAPFGGRARIQSTPDAEPAHDFGVGALPRLGGPVENELGAGITSVDPPKPTAQELARTCPLVKAALDTHGKDHDQPTWFQISTIANFLEDGREAFHVMSDGHPGYTREAADETFDRTLRTAREKNYGWPSCQKISMSGCQECKGCPLLSKGKSPFHHVTPSAVVPANPTKLANLLPRGYSRQQNGIVCRLVDTDGVVVEHPLCSYPMTDAWLQDHPWSLHFTTVNSVGKSAHVEIPMDALATKDALTKALYKAGMVVSAPDQKPLGEFFVSWVQTLQRSKESVVSATPFGWSVVGGKIEGFVYAGKVWLENGEDRPAASPDHFTKESYHPRGNLDPWIAAAKIITDQKRPGLDAIIASAFAGPLVRFTGQTGAMMNVYSIESGIGKTTAMRIAQAVWGHPKKALQGLNDTPNSVINRAGVLKTITVLWDELRGDPQTMRQFVQMVFQITQGKEKARLQADITQRDPGTWQTLLVTASNESLIEPIQRFSASSAAGLYRCFEFALAKGKAALLASTAPAIARQVAALDDNFGEAGLVYAKFLGEQHARVGAEVAQLQDALANEVNAGQDERFWIATMSVILAGAKFANELRLTEIDIPALKALLVTTLGNMRGEIKDAPTDMKNVVSISTILGQFLGAMRNKHTLRTNIIPVSAGKPKAGAITVISHSPNVENVTVQIGRDNRLMRISQAGFRAWLRDNDYPVQAMTKALKEDFNAKEVKGTLGGGTPFATSVEYLIQLDMNDPKLAPYLEIE